MSVRDGSRGRTTKRIPSGGGNWHAVVPQPHSGHVRTLQLAVENKDMELVKVNDSPSWNLFNARIPRTEEVNSLVARVMVLVLLQSCCCCRSGNPKLN